ncbi:hypothetical protein Bca4012_015149 [Brassica carinata]
MIDGPYGAPAQEYKKYEVVLLVGLGIGATPMISIIKDIINNMYAMENAQLHQMENGLQREPQDKNEKFKTRRAYFYWVTREQGSYDWFKNIMNEIAERDQNKIIELHNYCTSVFEEDDARSALIRMLQSIAYAKSGKDIVSETRVKSHFAKPNWEDVYNKIAMDHPDGTNVEEENSSDITAHNLVMETVGHAVASSVREKPEKKQNGLGNQIERFAGKPARLDRSKSTTGQALRGLEFISKADGADGWISVEKRFEKITKTTEGLLIRSKFGECIGMKSKDFSLVLFDALARRKHMTGDVIDKEILKEFWEQISDQNFDSRLMTFFDMMDKDGDGRLTEDEVRQIINLSSSTNNLSAIQKKATGYAAMIMEELDPHKTGYITVDNLKNLLMRAETLPEITNSEERKHLVEKITKKFKDTPYPHPIRGRYHRLRFFVLDNWQRIWVIALWLTIMAILFAYKYIQYKNRAVYEVLGHCVCFAKGSAETLKLNMALILLPVCRNTITWLRNKTTFGVLAPFDDNINFHKVVAVGITIGVGIHSIAHLACDFPRLIAATLEEYKPLGKYFGEEQPKRYSHFVKSTEGITGLVMVLLMAIAFTLALPLFRRGKLEKRLPVPLKKLASFNAFWYTHHLFIVVYILLIVHGYYLYLSKEWYKKTVSIVLRAVPIALYACERLMRAFRSSIRTVRVVSAAAYPGNVLTLKMSRPKHFKYKSGQYMFVNCPKVSPFEWHPFSITSAPHDGYLSVHIKSTGDWTKAIKEVFSEVTSKPASVRDTSHGANNPE